MKTLRNFGYFNVLASLPLCYFLFTNWYFWLLPAGVVFLIIAFVFRNEPLLSSGWQTAVGLLPVLSTTAVVLGVLVWADRPLRQAVLVPAGYRGVVVIGYGIASGQPQTWEDGQRLIRVSPQGMAAVQTKLEEGVRSAEADKFYGVAANGQRSYLPELLSQLPPPPGTVGVYHDYLEGELNTLVCVIARTDSLKYYLQDGSTLLRPAYAQQVKAKSSQLNPPPY